VVDEALDEKLDKARAARRWGDVARLATELEARAEERRRRGEREASGIIDLRARRGR
jgi:hypothetical protein